MSPKCNLEFEFHQVQIPIQNLEPIWNQKLSRSRSRSRSRSWKVCFSNIKRRKSDSPTQPPFGRAVAMTYLQRGPPIAENNPTTHRTHRTHRRTAQVVKKHCMDRSKTCTQKCTEYFSARLASCAVVMCHSHCHGIFICVPFSLLTQ